MTCGLHDAVPALTNAVVITPMGSERMKPLEGVAADVLRSLVGAGEPEWAVATPSSVQDAAYWVLGERPGPFVGQLTWLSRSRLPEEATKAVRGPEVQPLNGGYLLDATNLVGDVDRFADYVADLDRSGALALEGPVR